MLRFVLLVILFLVLRWRLRRGTAAPGRDVAAPTCTDRSLREMARDPVCEAYVAKSAALTTVAGGQVHYFCSSACYRSFLTASLDTAHGRRTG